MYKDKEKKLLSAKKYRLNNKEKIKESWKNYCLKNQDKIKEKRKTKEYKEMKHRSYLRNKTNVFKSHKKYRENHPWVYAYILIRNRALASGYNFTLTKKDFYVWFKNQPHKCYYCDLEDLSIDIIAKVKKTKRFTIDRMDNNKGYEFNNMCFACPVCNLSKSNLFTAQEWKEIAQKYIKPKWKGNHNG